MVLHTSRFIDISKSPSKQRKSSSVGKAMISKRLREEIQQRFQREESSILFSSRQTYSESMISFVRIKSSRICRFIRSKIKLKNFIISYKSKAKQRWDAVTIVLSIYNAVLIPCVFSFAVSFKFLQISQYLDEVIDVFFLLDNVLMFITTF